MTVSPILGTPPAAAGFELLAMLGELGWSCTIVSSGLGVKITARLGAHVVDLECRTVSEGARLLYEALRWL